MNDNEPQHPLCEKYHIHVYFSKEQTDIARGLQQDMTDTFGDKIPHDSWHDKNVGPHTAPQFLHLLPREHFEDVITWLNEHAGPLSVLVHPNTGDELWDHTTGAVWVGEKREINTQIFTPQKRRQTTGPKQ